MTVILPQRPARPLRVDAATPPASVTVDNGTRIPAGGSTGQALIKSSDSDYATAWGTATAAAAWGAVTGTLSAQTDLQAALDARQATLVSGVNIKTLNGSTILGSGDLVISASAAWGGITGTLSSQADLVTELNSRDTANRNRANHTGTQAVATITGLAAIATSGSASDLGAGTLPAARFNDTAHGNRAGGSLHADVVAGGASGFMTGADKTKLNAITGTNTGDQTITLTGDVTGSGTGSFAATIANNAVTNAKAADVPTATFKGRATAGTGDPEDLTVAQAKTLLNLTGINSGDQTITLTGDVTGSGTGSFAATIASDAVTNAKLANVATATLKGRTTAGTGDPEDLTGTQATALLDTFTSGAKGLVPASGGGTTNFLRADGTFAAPPGGGGGSPGGSTGEVQYNNAGAFAGAADVEIEGGQLRLPEITPPSAPAANGVKLFGREAAGHTMPAILCETGRALALQASFSDTQVSWWQASGNGATDTQSGFSAGSTGTSTAVTVATTNFRTRMRWREWLVTTAATTAVAGFRGGALMYTVGSNIANTGGFYLSIIWSPATGVTNASHRAFMGMRDTVAAPTDVDPSTMLRMCGMGYDSADTNIQFMHNDGSGTATKIDLGASFPKPNADRTKVYQLNLYSPPGTTQSVSYLVRDLGTGAEASGTVTTDLPSTTQLLALNGMISVGGVSSVVGLAVRQMIIETDF